jgi:hypothetical protein
MLSTHGNWDGSGSISMWRSMSIADPMYSLQLRVKALLSSSVKRCRHITPVFGQKPPTPASEASEKVVMVGLRKTTRLIEIPLCALSMKDSQSCRSLIVELDSLTFFLNLARYSILRKLFMKCLASGMTKQT